MTDVICSNGGLQETFKLLNVNYHISIQQELLAESFDILFNLTHNSDIGYRLYKCGIFFFYPQWCAIYGTRDLPILTLVTEEARDPGLTVTLTAVLTGVAKTVLRVTGAHSTAVTWANIYR